MLVLSLLLLLVFFFLSFIFSYEGVTVGKKEKGGSISLERGTILKKILVVIVSRFLPIHNHNNIFLTFSDQLLCYMLGFFWSGDAFFLVCYLLPFTLNKKKKENKHNSAQNIA